MAIQMGMGALGSADVVFKRKFRWTLEIKNCTGVNIPPYMVKVASRPSLSIEETEINFLNGKMWIPGKGSWETITVTFYDITGFGSAAASGATALYSWLATVYNFSDPINLKQSSIRGNIGGGAKGYAGEVILTSYDGCGVPLEEWTLGNCWPQAVNFGELDYSSSEEMTIEVTLRYSEATWNNKCGPQPGPCPCVSQC